MNKHGSSFIILWRNRNLASLMAGSGLSQIIIFLTTLIIVRIYSPSDYGRFSILVGLSGLLGPLFTFSIENFIAPSRQDALALNLFKYGIKRLIKSALIFTVLIVLLAVIFGSKNHFLNFSFGELLAVNVLCCLFGLYSLLTQLAVREMKFKRLSARGTIQNVSIGISQISASYLSRNSFGLLFGEIFGRLVGITFLIPILRRFSRDLTHSGKEEVYRRLERRLIFINCAAVFIELLCGYILIFSVNWIFGDSATGELSISMRILAVPTVLVAASLSQYFLSISSFAARDGKYLSVIGYKKLVLNLGLISIVFSCIIMFLTPSILPSLLGANWSGSPHMLLALLPSFVVSQIWSPLSNLFYVHSEWKLFFYITVLRIFLILIGLFCATITSQQIFTFVLVLSTCGSLAQVVGLIFLRRIIQKDSNSRN